MSRQPRKKPSHASDNNKLISFPLPLPRKTNCGRFPRFGAKTEEENKSLLPFFQHGNIRSVFLFIPLLYAEPCVYAKRKRKRNKLAVTKLDTPFAKK